MVLREALIVEGLSLDEVVEQAPAGQSPYRRVQATQRRYPEEPGVTPIPQGSRRITVGLPVRAGADEYQPSYPLRAGQTGTPRASSRARPIRSLSAEFASACRRGNGVGLAKL